MNNEIGVISFAVVTAFGALIADARVLQRRRRRRPSHAPAVQSSTCTGPLLLRSTAVAGGLSERDDLRSADPSVTRAERGAADGEPTTQAMLSGLFLDTDILISSCAAVGWSVGRSVAPASRGFAAVALTVLSSAAVIGWPELLSACRMHASMSAGDSVSPIYRYPRS
jgi:hypothetical protein